MRLAIVHDVNFAFEMPAKAMIALVRLTPRNEAGLFVHDWRIDVSDDAPVQRFQDPFGNVVHAFNLEGPLEEASVTATGTVETAEVNGVVGATSGRVPAEVFLRDTAKTAISPAVRALADGIGAEATDGDSLDFAHRLNGALSRDLAADGNDLSDFRTPAETLAEATGSAADLAHLFVAACRAAGLPARFVSGYRTYPAGQEERDGPHVSEGAFWSWAETLIPRLGWVSFDPTTGLSATETYVRVAAAPDADGAAPIRSHASGGGEVRSTSTVRVRSGRDRQPPGLRAGRAAGGAGETDATGGRSGQEQ